MRNSCILKSRWGFGELMGAVNPRTAVDTAKALVGGDVEVMCSSAQKNRFYICDDSKNLSIGPYHLREPETQRLKMKLGEFVECSRAWSSRRLMLKVRRVQTSYSQIVFVV